MQNMDRKQRKLKKYSERHLRRLAREETNLFLKAFSNESQSDTSEHEISGKSRPSTSKTVKSELPKPSTLGLETQIVSSSHSSVEGINSENPRILSDVSISSYFNTDDSISESIPSDDSLSLSNSTSVRPSLTTSFKQDLVQWAVNFNIPHNALSSLLVTINKHTDFSLPVDSRTLLRTPRQVEIKQLGTGLYYHFGLRKVLSLICADYTSCSINEDEIDLILNVDGLPLSKSSPSCLWPILCSEKIIKKVHLVGAYYGTEKPKSSNDFLNQLVEELVPLIENGFMHENKYFQVRLYALVCDTPAKSYVLNVKGHSGFSSCTKCNVRGDYQNDRVCFLDCSATPRTRESFINQSDEDYHNGETILITIPNFDPVLDVPSDYMHLVCLGVVKKIITLLIKGPLSVRISGAQKNRISSMLENLKTTVPNEFVRKPRNLKWWKQWKATELRQFLLYLGPLVLKQEVKEDVYLNFLSLHVAITILSSPIHLSKDENLSYAHGLLVHFIHSFGLIYGNEFISHNIHGLVHLSDDVTKYGALDNFSAFKFENYMLEIKKKLKKADKPLQQLAKRLEERSVMKNCNPINKTVDFPVFECLHKDGPLPNQPDHVDAQYKIYRTVKFYLNCKKEKDSCVMLTNGTVVAVSNIVLSNNQSFIVGRRHSVKEDFFSTPCQSSLFNILNVQFENTLKAWKTSEIECKMWKMPNTHQDSFVVVPVLHSR